MAELIQALTEFLKAATVYLEKQNGRYNPLPVGGDAKVDPYPKGPGVAPEDAAPAPARTRAPKKEKAAASGSVEMTEEESSKATTDVAKSLVAKFPAIVDGKPEGFHIAKKLLIDTYQVGRLNDLSHEQRLEFIAQVERIVAAGVNPFASAKKDDPTGL